MQSSSVASTARSPSAPRAQTHARSHSHSDSRTTLTERRDTSLIAPHSASAASAFNFHGAQHFGSEWQYMNATAAQAASNANPNPSMNVAPQVSFRAASPQSMVSSGSSSSIPSPSLRSDAPASNSGSTSTTKKSSLDRNRKPCGACSESKRKVNSFLHLTTVTLIFTHTLLIMQCTPVPGIPNLCERCRNQGRESCPPYVSWMNRKANIRDADSLSPLEVCFFFLPTI